MARTTCDKRIARKTPITPILASKIPVDHKSYHDFDDDASGDDGSDGDVVGGIIDDVRGDYAKKGVVDSGGKTDDDVDDPADDRPHDKDGGDDVVPDGDDRVLAQLIKPMPTGSGASSSGGGVAPIEAPMPSGSGASSSGDVVAPIEVPIPIDAAPREARAVHWGCFQIAQVHRSGIMVGWGAVCKRHKDRRADADVFVVIGN